jgi:hypothetical protein
MRRVLLCVPCLFFSLVGVASAASAAPGWAVDSVAAPTHFSPTAGGAYQLEVRNSGSVTSQEFVNGEPTPVVITDEIPEGLTVTSVDDENSATGVSGVECTTVGRQVTCIYHGVLTPETCPSAFLAACDSGSVLYLSIGVSVNGHVASESLTNRVTVSGGGAREVSATSTNEVSATPPAFGPANFDFFIDGLDGAADTEAGAHPYQLTTTIDLNTTEVTGKQVLGTAAVSVQDVKDIVVDLPLGFVASTLAAPQCTLAQLSSEARCPSDTIVGHIRTEPDDRAGEGSVGTAANSPIWNLTPERGAPAEFGFDDGTPNPHVFFAHVVPSASGYVLQATDSEVPQVPLAHVVVTFYGDPALRDGSGNTQIPFFTNPTACDAGPLKATIYMDSWQNPGSYNPDGTPDVEGDARWAKMTSESPPVTGCDELQFTPALLAQPTTFQADSPSGLEFELKVPQSEEPATHATPALKNATVALPEGMTVDPSAANGLEACSTAQIGWLGGSPFNFNALAPQCPEASKIGSLELETPLIGGVLTGEMYLASQNENPYGSVLATYVVVDDPTTGIVLKIAGELKSNPQTGQLTAYFPENAQLPFSDLKMHFFGGPRAELATPESCGLFTTTSDLAPWSAPDSGPDATPFDSFAIGSGCATAFAPTFTAGSSNLQAGAFSPFTVSLSRADTDQELGGLTATFPEGVSAILKGVPLCPEAQANAGTCPEASRIGTVTAGAGPGPNPLFVTGKIFLTTGYKGASFGESVVVPAVAGPFNFGDTIVRGAVFINPLTAQVTVVSDPFPRVLDPVGPNGAAAGIPIRLRRVDVTLDREGFMLNPTSCEKLQITNTLTSTADASSSATTPFQVTNCTTLKFTPKLTVSTPGRTSKHDGTSLSFKVAYPSGAIGTQSWVNETKFDIPKQLPARLTTLQQACLAKVFEANPAACPAAAVIGHAIVHTPVLPEPLTGPVYFVSFGSAKFPDAVMVLQGYNVKVELRGETFIDKKTGVTSATFRNTPDVPFENIEVTLPAGPFSEFGANIPEKDFGNMCKQKLAMPAFFKAQNGLEIHESTKIAITGCAKSKPPRKARRAVKRAKAGRRH